MTNTAKKFFIFILFMSLPVSAMATEIGSVTYGSYVILYEGTENAIFKGTSFDVYRGTNKIGELIITDSYSTNSKGLFQPIEEKYLPLTTRDRLVSKEKASASPKNMAPDEKSPDSKSPATKETTVSSESTEKPARSNEQAADTVEKTVNPKTPSAGLKALSPTTVITQGYALSMEYNPMGTVGKVSATNSEVNSDGMNISVSYGEKSLQARYTRRVYNTEAILTTGTKDLNADADVLDIKYRPEDIKIPWNGSIALGAFYYVNGNEEFTQPYGVFSTSFENIDVNAGVNSVFGDVLYKNGFFISLGYKIIPELSLFVDYSSVDSNKSIVNSLILPQAKINCNKCSLDSTSLGLIYKFSPNMNVLLAMYDVNDIDSFFSSVSYELAVGKK